MRDAFRKALTSLLLILIASAGVRVAFAWNQARKIPPDVLGIVPFQQEAGNIAYSLAQGQGFSSVFRTNTGPTAWLAPVYPLLVAAIFKLFGTFTAPAFFAAVSLNILCSSAAGAPIYFAGKRVAGLGAASTAAWLWALFPSAIVMPFEWIWDSSLSALLAATLLWATLKLPDSARRRDWCAYGLLWGLALMTNPALGSLLPFLAGWAIYTARSRGPAPWKEVAMAIGVILLCCAPWTIRNYAAFHRFIPLRSNLPFELWLGNNDIFDEHARNGRTRITRYEEIRTYTQLGETAYMQQKWKLATAFIFSHPGLELRLAGKRIVAFWMGTDSPLRDFRATSSLLLQGVFLCSLFTAVGAFAGIAILFHRRSPFAFPLAIVPLVFPGIYYVTHADLRYRHTIDPVVLLLAAITAAALFEWSAGLHSPRASASRNPST